MEKSPEPRPPCREGALPWGAGVWGLRTSMDVPLSPTRSKGWGQLFLLEKHLVSTPSGLCKLVFLCQ